MLHIVFAVTLRTCIGGRAGLNISHLRLSWFSLISSVPSLTLVANSYLLTVCDHLPISFDAVQPLQLKQHN